MMCVVIEASDQWELLVFSEWIGWYPVMPLRLIESILLQYIKTELLFLHIRVDIPMYLVISN